jgi:CrcB protein
MILIAIAAGGALGSVLRYLTGLALQPLASGLPIATLLINVSGSFLLGLLYGALDHGASPALRAFAGIGFCGGFTTFSAFSLETVRMIQDGDTLMAGSYTVASVLFSVLATLGGIALGAALRR